jgi:hypothetical protein
MKDDHDLAAIDSVSEVPWREIQADVQKRESVVREIAQELSANSISAAMEIAATDVFVEKAEKALNSRSHKMKRLAYISLVFVAVITTLTVAALFFPAGLFLADASNIQTTALSAFHNFAALGVLLGLVYLGTSLLRAFLHEAMVLDNRVHSLRLGRLYIYLKLASVSKEELSKVREALNAAEVERIFGWNIESSSAFKDIRPEYMTRNLLGQIVDAVGKLARKKE